MAQTKRKLATGATLLAALGSIGPFAGSAEATAESDNNKLATIEDYARQDFEPWAPGSIDVIGDRAKWIERVSQDYIGVRLAIAALERTPAQLAAFQDEETANIAIETAAALARHVRTLQGAGRHADGRARPHAGRCRALLHRDR